MKFKIAIFLLVLLVVVGLSFGATVYLDYQKTVSDDPLVWEDDIQRFRNFDEKFGLPKKSIVFVGSSSIRLWKNIKSKINGRLVLNRGFGGARIADIEYYLEDLVIKYNPDLVVLYIGIVDLALESGLEKESVFTSLYALCKDIRDKLPHSKLAIIALRPSPYRKEALGEYANFNRNIEEMAAKDSQVYYIDANDSLVDEYGVLRKDIYRIDRQHLNDTGYSLWGNEIENSIGEILKEI